MTHYGAIMFSGGPWGWVATAVFCLTLALLFYAYRPSRDPLCRWACPALKALGIAALAFCLLEPLMVGQRARPGANVFAVLADNSEGLQLKDAGESRTRGEQLREMLVGSVSGWQDTLAETFDARRYYFDTRLQPTKNFDELDFRGRASGIGGALKGLQQRYEDRPFAGVLMFTDGNATDVRGMPDTKGLPPIYPVVIGSPDPVPDLAIEQVRVTQTDFEDAPVTVQAEVRATTFQQDATVARLVDEAGKVVAEQRVTPRSAEQVLTFRFELRPEQPGLSLYRLEVRAAAEEASVEGNATREATLVNNRQTVVVQRGKGPYRILYVAGRPQWEYKYLNRALDEDRMLQMVGLIRVARREPKFNFIGRAGETSNPLFRGFGDQSPEEVERYDQPVLVRLNTVDESELSGGFPRTAEALYAYHAVIVDDLEAEFFKSEQAMLLQKFVSERGGGFLMLGGMETFREGNYQRTPIGEMLPVYLNDTEEAPAGGEVRMSLTKEGLLQSWARLRETEVGERERLDQMRTFKVMNRVGGARPGATVIATARDEITGRQSPALVVQRYGHGRTAALTIGDVWLWGMRDKNARKDMEKSWRQLMRWLVNDAPNRVELMVEERPEEDTSGVRLDVRVRDEKFQPLENANVRLMVEAVGTRPGTSGNVTRMAAEPSAGEAGLYQATYVPQMEGGYKVYAYVTNSAGVEVGRAEAGWSANPAGEEFRSLTPNLALLEHLARSTGGEVLQARDLEAFVRGLPNRRAPKMEPWVRPLWHTPTLFAFALLCFVSEWGLRRWKGMP